MTRAVGRLRPGLAARAPRRPQWTPRAMPRAVGGRSTSTQWKKSTRGSDAGTTRPSWFTSSPRDGTSGSWHRSASERVPGGTSRHAKSGLRLADSLTCATGSMTANANSPGNGRHVGEGGGGELHLGGHWRQCGGMVLSRYGSASIRAFQARSGGVSMRLANRGRAASLRSAS